MNPNKLTIIIAACFSVLTVIAVAMDTLYPEGMYTTPQIERRSIKDGSPHAHGHGGFRFGK